MKHLKSFEWTITYDEELEEISIRKGYAQVINSLDEIKTKRDLIDYMIYFFKDELETEEDE